MKNDQNIKKVLPKKVHLSQKMKKMTCNKKKLFDIQIKDLNNHKESKKRESDEDKKNGDWVTIF